MNPVATTLLVQDAFVLLASGWRTVARTRATGSTDPQRALANGEPTVDLTATGADLGCTWQRPRRCEQRRGLCLL